MNTFWNSFHRIGDMSREYSIGVDANTLQVQHGRCGLPIEAREDIEVLLREMTAHGIITPQTEPTPLVSYLT